MKQECEHTESSDFMLGELTKPLHLARVSCATLALSASVASAQDYDEDGLALELQNPVAALISVPFQFNYEDDIGAGQNGSRSILNIQPVIPFSLNEEWNLISRTIIPYIDQEDVTGPGEKQSGFGDIVQSFFFSPKAPTKDGWIWGAGPVVYLPTGSSDFSQDQFGLGPTGVALRQQGGWTYGGLANHIWGIDPNDGKKAINSTFLQPFISYTTPNAWSFVAQTESIYDWNAEQWTVPVGLVVSKVVTVGQQPVSFSLGIREFVDAPATGPDGTAFRFNITLLFPK